MSSPVPPPSPRSRRPDHSFELSSDFKFSSKGQRTNKPTRRRGVPKSSSFSKQEPVSANATAAISGQSTLKRSYILDWLTGNLSKHPPGSSPEGSSSSQPNPKTTNNSGSNLPLGKSSLQCIDVSKSSQQRTSSPLPSGSATRVQSSFRPWHAPESGSSSRGTCSSPGLDVKQMKSSSIDMLPGRFASGYVDKGHAVDDKQTDSSAEKMVKSFEAKLSILGMDKGTKEEEHNSKQARKGSKDEKPVITYVRRHKMAHHGVEKNRNRKEMQMVKENKPVDVPDEGEFHNINEKIPVDVPDEGDFDDMKEKVSNFWSTKFHKNTQILNLEKNVAPSFKDQEGSVQENEDKKGKTAQESNQGSGDKKSKGKEPEKEKKKKKKKEKKKKNKETEPNQHPQIEINLPKFSRQLTPQEIAEDIFAMTGRMPSTKPKRRTKNVQRQVDQLTPGLWLESIDADRYKVNEKSKKGK